MTFQYKRLRSTGKALYYNRMCYSCNHEFQSGEQMNIWRLKNTMEPGGKFHSGSFWWTDCNTCYRQNLEEWNKDINTALSNINND